MPNQQGSVAPLLIFAVIISVIAVAALFFLGIIKMPGSTQTVPVVTPPPSSAPLQTPPPSQESSPSAKVASPSADYSNPFSSDDTYENPFNSL